MGGSQKGLMEKELFNYRIDISLHQVAWKPQKGLKRRSPNPKKGTKRRHEHYHYLSMFTSDFVYLLVSDLLKLIFIESLQF